MIVAMPTDQDRRQARFRAALIDARKAKGLSQTALGDLLGVAQSTVGQWETGKWLTGPDQVFEVERVLELEPGALSKHLGYLPITSDGAVPAMSFRDFLDEIDESQLTDGQRRVLLEVYREFAEPAGQSEDQPADLDDARIDAFRDELRAGTKSRRRRRAVGDSPSA